MRPYGDDGELRREDELFDIDTSTLVFRVLLAIFRGIRTILPSYRPIGPEPVPVKPKRKRETFTSPYKAVFDALARDAIEDGKDYMVLPSEYGRDMQLEPFFVSHVEGDSSYFGYWNSPHGWVRVYCTLEIPPAARSGDPNVTHIMRYEAQENIAFQAWQREIEIDRRSYDVWRGKSF